GLARCGIGRLANGEGVDREGWEKRVGFAHVVADVHPLAVRGPTGGEGVASPRCVGPEGGALVKSRGVVTVAEAGSEQLDGMARVRVGHVSGIVLVKTGAKIVRRRVIGE